MAKYFLQGFGVVGLVKEERTVGSDCESVGEGGVECTLPPRGEMGVGEGPSEAGGGDGGAGVEGEKGDLLVGEGGESLSDER